MLQFSLVFMLQERGPRQKTRLMTDIITFGVGNSTILNQDGKTKILSYVACFYSKCLAKIVFWRAASWLKFPFFFWTWIWFLGIRLKKSSLAFDKVNELEKSQWDWKKANSLFKRRFRGRPRRGILNSLISRIKDWNLPRRKLGVRIGI